MENATPIANFKVHPERLYWTNALPEPSFPIQRKTFIGVSGLSEDDKLNVCGT